MLIDEHAECMPATIAVWLIGANADAGAATCCIVHLGMIGMRFCSTSVWTKIIKEPPLHLCRQLSPFQSLAEYIYRAILWMELGTKQPRYHWMYPIDSMQMFQLARDLVWVRLVARMKSHWNASICWDVRYLVGDTYFSINPVHLSFWSCVAIWWDKALTTIYNQYADNNESNSPNRNVFGKLLLRINCTRNNCSLNKTFTPARRWLTNRKEIHLNPIRLILAGFSTLLDLFSPRIQSVYSEEALL